MGENGNAVTNLHVLHYMLLLVSQGIANGMFSHLMGHRHRQRFVEEIYKEDPSRVMDLSQGDLLKYARKHNENGDDLGKRIRSRRSDEVGCGQSRGPNNE